MNILSKEERSVTVNVPDHGDVEVTVTVTDQTYGSTEFLPLITELLDRREKSLRMWEDLTKEEQDALIITVRYAMADFYDAVESWIPKSIASIEGERIEISLSLFFRDIHGVGASALEKKALAFENSKRTLASMYEEVLKKEEKKGG